MKTLPATNDNATTPSSLVSLPLSTMTARLTTAQLASDGRRRRPTLRPLKLKLKI